MRDFCRAFGGTGQRIGCARDRAFVTQTAATTGANTNGFTLIVLMTFHVAIFPGTSRFLP